MSDPEIHERLEEVKRAIGWGATTGSARRWWEAFEDENRHQLGVLLRLAQELAARKATITKFFIVICILEHNQQPSQPPLPRLHPPQEEGRGAAEGSRLGIRRPRGQAVVAIPGGCLRWRSRRPRRVDGEAVERECHHPRVLRDLSTIRSTGIGAGCGDYRSLTTRRALFRGHPTAHNRNGGGLAYRAGNRRANEARRGPVLASPTAMLIVAVLESSSMPQKRDDFGCRSGRVPPLHPSRGPATRGATNPLTAGRSINVTQ